jgi:hypothetical protein
LRVKHLVHTDDKIRERPGSGLLAAMEDAVLAVAGPIER